MPYKSDDLRELFENAGNDYPLRTDSSNWDDVAAKLNAATRKGKLLGYAFFFLLLLSSSLLFYKQQVLPDKIAKRTQNIKPSVNSGEVAGNTSAPQLNLRMPGSMKTALSIKDLKADKGQDNRLALASTLPGGDLAVRSRKTALFIGKDLNADKLLKLNETISLSSDYLMSDSKTSSAVFSDRISENAGNLNISGNIATSGSSKSSRNVVKFRSSELKFYGTFYGGPEFSMVNFQKIVAPGYRLGIALGYRINKRFDIEIGLQRERTNFYSDGKYFDRTALKIKSEDAVLVDIEGHSKITNVPVTVKYNFASKRNGHFYAAAGINVAQITHTENYDFVTLRNRRTERDRSREFSSASAPKYFTGIIASAGYEVKVCDLFNMKAEPYYQIPVQDFGVGKLPVASFGVNLGVVKRLK